MKMIYCKKTVVTVAIAVAMSLSLVACDDSSSAKDETPISSSEIEEMPSSSSVTETSEIECNAENEGVYKTVLDTLTVYDDGNAMVWNKYYHCEAGEWVKTECRDPQEACTGDSEGEYQDVVCTAQYNDNNPKSPRTTWTFKCVDKKWKKLTDEEKSQLAAEKGKARVEEICNEQTEPETKLGDTCSIVTNNTTNVRFGITGPSILTCYVYTEEGWVAKGSAVMSGNTSCEDILNPPADSTETPVDSVTAPVDTAAAE